jgi:integrase
MSHIGSESRWESAPALFQSHRPLAVPISVQRFACGSNELASKSLRQHRLPQLIEAPQVCRCTGPSPIDRRELALNVCQSVQRLGRTTLVPPKTQRGRRQVTLPASTIALLREHRACQLAQRLTVRLMWREHGLVFTDDLGLPLVDTTVSNGFRRALGRAGLPQLRFHDLHGTASLLLAEGVNPRVVMERMGHITMAITHGTYSRVTPALDQHAAERLDRALGGR